MVSVEPQQLRVGDTWSWRRSVPGYSASEGWSLRYELVTIGQRIVIDAVAEGDDFLVLVPANVTAQKVAGRYQWLARVLKGADVFSIGQGMVQITPDFASAVDSRSHARKVLDAIEAVLEQRATRDQEEYSIAGRSLKRTSIGDLLKLRDQYKKDVALEAAADNMQNGLATGHRILVRF